MLYVWVLVSLGSLTSRSCRCRFSFSGPATKFHPNKNMVTWNWRYFYLSWNAPVIKDDYKNLRSSAPSERHQTLSVFQCRPIHQPFSHSAAHPGLRLALHSRSLSPSRSSQPEPLGSVQTPALESFRYTVLSPDSIGLRRRSARAVGSTPPQGGGGWRMSADSPQTNLASSQLREARRHRATRNGGIIKRAAFDEPPRWTKAVGWRLPWLPPALKGRDCRAAVDVCCDRVTFLLIVDTPLP